MTEEQSSPQPQAAQPAADDQEKLFAAVGYFAFLFVVPLIVKPKSEYCQWHAKQSMVLFLITVLDLVLMLVSAFIGSLTTLALMALYVLAIYRAYIGDHWKIPVVGDFAEKINVNALYGKAGGVAAGLGDLHAKAAKLSEKASAAVQGVAKNDQAGDK